jgi:hypothetical protein
MKMTVFVLMMAFFLLGCYLPLNNEDEEIPVAPTALTASIEVSTEGLRFVRLHWTDNSSNETGFKIARKPGKGIYFVVQQVSRNATSYDDYPPNTEFGTTYTYKVRAITNFYNSESSNEVTITFM